MKTNPLLTASESIQQRIDKKKATFQALPLHKLELLVLFLWKSGQERTALVAQSVLIKRNQSQRITA